MKIAALEDDPLQLETVLGVIAAAGFRGTGFSRANALISTLRREGAVSLTLKVLHFEGCKPLVEKAIL